MTGFLKIRYNANGLLKNRIINADAIDFIEPFSGPGGRYVEETRSRIFMKNGATYDMSLTLEDIQKLLREAGVLVAEIHSRPPQGPIRLNPPAAPANLYKRPTVVRPAEAARAK